MCICTEDNLNLTMSSRLSNQGGAFVLIMAACAAVSLLHAWQQSKTSKERQKVAKEIAQMLNKITNIEAQNLPNKDP